jgi:hypothetical protein
MAHEVKLMQIAGAGAKCPAAPGARRMRVRELRRRPQAAPDAARGPALQQDAPAMNDEHHVRALTPARRAQSARG